MFRAEHNQYKVEVAHENEQLLATKIKDFYCQNVKFRRNQVMLLAQSSGLLASNALDLEPCTRLKGYGQTLAISKCKLVEVDVGAVETNCGMAPIFNLDNNTDMNYTIGRDGLSIVEFKNCFHRDHYITFNGSAYYWEVDNDAGNWVLEPPTFHAKI